MESKVEVTRTYTLELTEEDATRLRTIVTNWRRDIGMALPEGTDRDLISTAVEVEVALDPRRTEF